jgi:D-glycero-D-manno-heptose 1,7-bisphosphate phosphatase
MKRPAVFFDRDNTLIVSDGYLGNPAEVKLIDGAPDAVARTRKMGFAAVTISNQSGVARGMFTEDAVRSVNRRMDDLLRAANPSAVIEMHEFCPFHPDATVPQYKHDSELRKPKPGMILRAAQNLALDLSRSWVIGDAPRDIEAGNAAGCRTILFANPDLAASPAANEPMRVEPDFTVASLSEALDIIDRNTTYRSIVPQPSRPAMPTQDAPKATENSRTDALLEQILLEVKRRNEVPHAEFSVSKLLAGIVQIIVPAVLFFAYLHLGDEARTPLLLFAIYLQILVIALLVMGRQR